MSKFLNSELVERLLFTLIVIGILMTLISAVRFVYLSNEIGNNVAAQVRATGEEVPLETMNEAQGLMASDLERRKLVNDRFNMMVVGGVGLALIGVGWIMTDIMRSRRKKDNESPKKSVAEATS
jgi:hypothetical protein